MITDTTFCGAACIIVLDTISRKYPKSPVIHTDWDGHVKFLHRHFQEGFNIRREFQVKGTCTYMPFLQSSLISIFTGYISRNTLKSIDHACFSSIAHGFRERDPSPGTPVRDRTLAFAFDPGGR
jgi:hypothetical protein